MTASYALNAYLNFPRNARLSLGLVHMRKELVRTVRAGAK